LRSVLLSHTTGGFAAVVAVATGARKHEAAAAAARKYALRRPIEPLKSSP
jgi:hypothetical protein